MPLPSVLIANGEIPCIFFWLLQKSRLTASMDKLILAGYSVNMRLSISGPLHPFSPRTFQVFSLFKSPNQPLSSTKTTLKCFLKSYMVKKLKREIPVLPLGWLIVKEKKKKKLQMLRMYGIITFVHYVVKLLKWYSHSRKQYEGSLCKKLKIGLSYDHMI